MEAFIIAIDSYLGFMSWFLNDAGVILMEEKLKAWLALSILDGFSWLRT